MTGDRGADKPAPNLDPEPSEPAPRDPERRPLTPESVTRAALELVDAEGLSALTMRRLGRDPMSVYRHTPSRGDLLDGVAELVLSTCGAWPASWAVTTARPSCGSVWTICSPGWPVSWLSACLAERTELPPRPETISR